MAALTTYDASSNENPLVTLWATLSGLADCKGVSGVLSPVTAASDSGCVSASSWTATDNGTTTLAATSRWTLGAMTAGSEIRLIYTYTDASNYYYVKVQKKAVVVTASTSRDRVTLWKVVSGTHSQIGSGRALLHYQLEVGDTREEEIEAGTTIRVIHVSNQHIVELDDVRFLHEEDSSLTAGGKIGFVFVGSAHTNTITKVQAQTMTTYWCATTGSDTNTGARTAPFLTRTKMTSTVTVNTLGIFRAATFTGSTTITAGSGTSREDGPRMTAYRSETVTWQASGVSSEMQVFAGTSAKYWHTSNFVIKGNGSTTGKYGINVTGGMTHLTAVDVDVQDIQNTGILLVPIGSGTYTGHHVIRDYRTTRCGLSTFQDHGVYNSTQDTDVAYGVSDGQSLSQGYGIHVFSSSATTACNNSSVRWCRVKDHTHTSAAGVILSKGTGLVGRGLDVSGCYVGVQLWYTADGAILEHSLIEGNASHGVSMGGGATTTGAEVAHCTIEGNGGRSVFGETLNVGGLVKNCIEYNNTGGTAGGTNITTTTNFTSDPKFIDVATRNYRLLDTSTAFETGTDLTADGVTQRDYWMQVIPQGAAVTPGAFSETTPPDTAPTITVSSAYAVLQNVAYALSDGVVDDAEGDVTYLDGVFDNLTTTVAVSGSPSGTLTTRS